MSVPCTECKGKCSVGPFYPGGATYRCDHCMSHGSNSGIEPCVVCHDDADLVDDEEALCFPCAEARGVDLSIRPVFAEMAVHAEGAGE